MSRGQAWLNSKLQTAAGVSTVYARGAYTLNLTPWVGRTVFASNLEGNARIEFGERDYLIPAANLILNGATTEPAIGDRITETVGGESKVFEIMRPSNGEPAWRWSDSSQTRYRIHVKRVS